LLPPHTAERPQAAFIVGTLRVWLKGLMCELV